MDFTRRDDEVKQLMATTIQNNIEAIEQEYVGAEIALKRYMASKRGAEVKQLKARLHELDQEHSAMVKESKKLA